MKLSEIARALGGELRGDGGVEIVEVAPIEDAPPGTLTFLADRRLAPRLAATRAAAVHTNVTIDEDVAIGDGFTAHAGVVVGEGTRIGDRVVLHAGAVIGSDGFGYLPLPEGIRKIPQIGTVVLEDEVEVGANATVD